MTTGEATTALRAIVTGGSGAVGESCVRSLHAAGCVITLLGRNVGGLGALADDLARSGERPEVVRLDLGSDFDLATRVESWSNQRLLLLNAGAVHGPLHAVAGADLAAWEHTITVHTIGLVRLLAPLLPVMIKSGWGRVVQVSSAASVGPAGGYNSAYAVSKSAADTVLAHLAAELAGSGVTVHSLHPGEIRSAMWADIAAQSAGRSELAGFTAWAEETARRPDDPELVGRWLVRVLVMPSPPEQTPTSPGRRRATG